MKLNKGLYIALEGPDGSGKTTFLPYIESLLQQSGLSVVTTRAPGGSEYSEKIRETILGSKVNEKVDPMTETFLIMASHVQNYRATIEPNIKEGKIVLADRSIISAHVYQGYARNVEEKFAEINKWTGVNLIPDIIIYFDIDFQTANERLAARQKEYNRLNAEDLEFKRTCFEGYSLVRKAYSTLSKVFSIDAGADACGVEKQLLETIDSIKRKFLL